MTPEEKADNWCVENMDCCVREVFGDKEVLYFDEEERCVAKSAFLDGHSKGFDEGYKKATERAYKRQQDLTDTYIKDGEKIKQLKKENEELKNAVKLLIATLDDTTWDEGHPGYADSEPGYRCPNFSCKDCYRISCKYNESELFKKLHKEFPGLYEK